MTAKRPTKKMTASRLTKKMTAKRPTKKMKAKRPTKIREDRHCNKQNYCKKTYKKNDYTKTSVKKWKAKRCSRKQVDEREEVYQKTFDRGCSQKCPPNDSWHLGSEFVKKEFFLFFVNLFVIVLYFSPCKETRSARPSSFKKITTSVQFL